MKKSKIKKLVKEEVIKMLKKRESNGNNGAPLKAKKRRGKDKLHSKKEKAESIEEKEIKN